MSKQNRAAKPAPPPAATQMISNLQPILLCEQCGSLFHSIATCPTKKKETKENLAYYAKHSSSDSDSDSSIQRSEVDSFNSDESKEITYMLTTQGNDNDEDYLSDEPSMHNSEYVEFQELLRRVARTKRVSDIEEWVHSVTIKFEDINIKQCGISDKRNQKHQQKIIF